MKANVKHCSVMMIMMIILSISALIHTLHSEQALAHTVSTTTNIEQDVSSNADQVGTIMLDAGHGGYDSGGVGIDGSLEKDISLAITLNVGYFLSDAGYDVAYTRTSDEVSWISDNVADLETRVALAQEVNASYYISIHTNFSRYNDGAAGFETYLDEEKEGMEAIALSIHEQLSMLNYSVDRGLKDTRNSPLYVIDRNPIPSLLLEVGFLSDSNDTAYIQENSTSIAKSIANGIIHALAKE